MQRPELVRWLAYQVAIIVFCALAVAAGLILIFRQDPGITLIYCFTIATSCSFFIQSFSRASRLLLRRLGDTSEERQHWPGWPLMVVSLVLGTYIGYSVGTLAGNAITGRHEAGLHDNHNTRNVLAILFVSLIPGFGVTYFFLSRGRLAAAELRAETAKAQAAETQLRLLESQLEPHMLFNTLANLRVLIGMDPPRAQAMLDHMIAFLRATLTASRSGSHPLKEEFARLRDYLALMQVRMGPRLQPVFELPAGLEEQPVPPLLLQPLVENAIKHGLEPKIDGGELRIAARAEGGQLILEVRDGGVGLGQSPETGTQFGLHQVRERLATRYGDAATLSLAPAAGSGTLATVTLPLS
ncbi:sensor histidine kinase [Pelomonas sp. KK5]|uniref:sensor histidine kinase n=1 Tax=Pelomonas sp. KK5 TaxID=1855730 RepID=UPI00097CB480|nr:histidine kinase [Pelomonas sp. KK5]